MKMTAQLITRLLFIAVMISVLASCGSPSAGDEDYVSWVRNYENGMHVRHVQNDLTFDLQFQPSEYVWMQRNGDFKADVFESEREDLDRMQFFTLNIYSEDGKTDLVTKKAEGDEEREKELLYYFSYRFQSDISVENEGKQLPCTLFHYEQYGTKSFVLGFEKGKLPVNDVTLVINSPLVDMNPVKIKIFTDPKVL